MTEALPAARQRPALWLRFSRADLLFMAAIVVLVIFASLASDAPFVALKAAMGAVDPTKGSTP